MPAFSLVRPIKTLTSLALASAMLFTSGTGFAQQVLRVSVIPDGTPAELQQKFKPLGEYLEKKLDVKVKFVPATDYPTLVEDFVSDNIDLAWFNGYAFVQANVQTGKKAIPIVQRKEDDKFRSVFITTARTISTLQDLKGKSFSFGLEASTAGHLMPRSYLLAAHISPDIDMRHIAYSGSDDATFAAAAGGKVDAGVLSIAIWQKLVSEHKVNLRAVRVFYTTPPYNDYNWSVRADMNPELRKKLTDAFLALNGDDPQDKKILELQHTAGFIPTKTENYAAIEIAARDAGLLK